MSKLKKRSAASGTWMEQRTAWHLAALHFAYSQIAAHVHDGLDGVTKRVVMRRLGKLESLVDMFNRSESHPLQPPAAPFAYDDAAALVLWPRRKAVKLARALGIHEQYVHIFNFDWFDFKLPA